MGPTPLASGDKRGLCAIIDEATSDPRLGLPCAAAVLVGDGRRNDANLLDYSVSPDGGTGKGDDIYWLASCTKLVTTVACMQLVEKNLLSLDDADVLERLCPELKEVKVRKANGTLVPKERSITLRMLLTHTSGFGYSFLNESLEKHGSREFNEFSGNVSDFQQPLIDQPGAGFHYGISIDWAGIVAERASGMKLNEYMTRHIFNPLGIQDLTMVPSTDMVARCAGLWQRDDSGELIHRNYPLQAPLTTTAAPDFFHSGGAGLFGSIRQFSKILRVLLNDGVVAETGQRILSDDSVAEMFTNQLPENPNFARKPLPAVKPDLVYEALELYPLCPPDKPQGWGLGFMISPGITGRSNDTAHWSGLSNVFWWCDRQKGVAGIVGSQVLPFVDPKAAELWVRVEQALYTALEKKGV